MESTVDLVVRARAGDQDAWRGLVGRFGPLVWHIARERGLGVADAGDVSQATWIALAEGIGGLREPGRVAYWLATTAKRECARVVARGVREWPVEWVDGDGGGEWPEVSVIRRERDDLLWRAFQSLPGRCRAVLGLVAFAPEMSYAQVARVVGLADSSVGRTRGRCLEVLRRRLGAVVGVAR